MIIWHSIHFSCLPQYPVNMTIQTTHHNSLGSFCAINYSFTEYSMYQFLVSNLFLDISIFCFSNFHIFCFSKFHIFYFLMFHIFCFSVLLIFCFSMFHIFCWCFSLLSIMLVRDPKKRASLQEILNHHWLTRGDPAPLPLLPLISWEHLTSDEHSLIISKMVARKMASKEEILK